MNIRHTLQASNTGVRSKYNVMTWLAIVATGVVLYWVPGGLPPSSWRLLFQTASQLPSLWSSYGNTLLFPFISLCIQSLILAFAWGLLVWVIFRNVMSILRTQSPVAMPDIQAARRPRDGVTSKKQNSVQILPHYQEYSPVVAQTTPRVAAGVARRTSTKRRRLDQPVPVQVQESKPLSYETQQMVMLPARSIPLVDVVSHPGIARAHKPNEDSYLQMVVTRQASSQAPLAVGLFLVADGMGGYENGKYASSSVIEAVRTAIEAGLSNPLMSSEQLREKLVMAVKQANAALFARNQQANNFCGTTLTGAILMENADSASGGTPTYSAHIVNIGDSRTYWYSHTNGFMRVTRDHSVVEELIANGVITPEERYTDRRRNEIYRCLGDNMDVDVDVFAIELQVHDKLLFCSDGLWEMTRDDDLGNHMSLVTTEPSQITSRLLQAALDGGGKDNVTALVVLVAEA